MSKADYVGQAQQGAMRQVWFMLNGWLPAAWTMTANWCTSCSLKSRRVSKIVPVATLRIYKIEPRHGDRAEMVLLELTEREDATA